jgi:hypothetical protein
MNHAYFASYPQLHFLPFMGLLQSGQLVSLFAAPFFMNWGGIFFDGTFLALAIGGFL